ncbi:RluA family pseudouridine synthase [Lacicoccus qingdaonensis]|uniref:Pseudouridine synthase n=1 Tax=Lacicoccus qingdaonensis TaxID=576118 RepID=A0A1G9GLF2_9BACL|nr:RluA family pseudouridine synthase [Salinicoccus qingdaonensis]SDL01486.1 23S rRNA pseudouridine1911/1915/1917 synthase [Salinicoccus qingdaonensis]
MTKRININEPEEEWIVDESTELLKFLFKVMPERSKKSVKGILSRRQVFVNGESTTQFNDPLSPGDSVSIEKRTAKHDARIRGVKILHEDEDIIVIEKEAGLLSIASEKENKMTAYRQLSDYMQHIHPKSRIFVVHRLDRDTSGVMIFAKSKRIQQKLQNAWQESVPERSYIALVEGTVKEDGTITSWLTENKALMVRSSKNPNKGKKAITNYKVLKSNSKLSLLQVNLETGRKNQIRVHMQDLKHPIVGDKKYGSHINPIKRVGLHAQTIGFIHPTTKEYLKFESKVPDAFTKIF